jgi:hypothetical protein
MAVLTQGHIQAGRVSGSYSDALKHYNQTTEGWSKKFLLPSGLPRCSCGIVLFSRRHIFSVCLRIVDEALAAIRTLDGLMQPPNPQKSLEARAIPTSLRLQARPGVSSSDAAHCPRETKAREWFDRVYRTIEQYDDAAAQNWNASGSERPPLRIVLALLAIFFTTAHKQTGQFGQSQRYCIRKYKYIQIMTKNNNEKSA